MPPSPDKLQPIGEMSDAQLRANAWAFGIGTIPFGAVFLACVMNVDWKNASPGEAIWCAFWAMLPLGGVLMTAAAVRDYVRELRRRRASGEGPRGGGDGGTSGM